MDEDFSRILLLNSMKTNVIRTRIFIIRIVTSILRHILAIKNEIFFTVHNHGARISVNKLASFRHNSCDFFGISWSFLAFIARNVHFFLCAPNCCLINSKCLSKTPLTHSCPVIDQSFQSFAPMCVQDGRTSCSQVVL